METNKINKTLMKKKGETSFIERSKAITTSVLRLDGQPQFLITPIGNLLLEDKDLYNIETLIRAILHAAKIHVKRITFVKSDQDIIPSNTVVETLKEANEILREAVKKSKPIFENAGPGFILKVNITIKWNDFLQIEIVYSIHDPTTWMQERLGNLISDHFEDRNPDDYVIDESDENFDSITISV